MSKKTIFIAGGTDGIGFAFLKLCLRSGDYKKLYVLGRDFKKVTRLKSKSIVALKCNITDGDEMSSTLRKVKEPLDEFVNTIGTFHKQPIKDLKPEVIKKHFELNSTGNITLTTLMLPKLKKQFSQILVCLATLAIETRPEYSIQSATKVAYRFFLETLRYGSLWYIHQAFKRIFSKKRVMRERFLSIHPQKSLRELCSQHCSCQKILRYTSTQFIIERIHKK
jgi:NADP-dependent 3-hydroxy acid dehydrogenase YdfG